jgi:hypothetical protein
MLDTVASEALLPEIDRDFLEDKGYTYTVARAGGEILLIIRDYDLGAAYMPARADLMIVLPAGYPNASPDMFWTFPTVKLANGSWPTQAQHHQVYGDRNWQRWSRHFHLGWRPGVDNLRPYLAAIRKELAKGI